MKLIYTSLKMAIVYNFINVSVGFESHEMSRELMLSNAVNGSHRIYLCVLQWTWLFSTTKKTWKNSPGNFPACSFLLGTSPSSELLCCEDEEVDVRRPLPGTNNGSTAGGISLNVWTRLGLCFLDCSDWWMKLIGDTNGDGGSLPWGGLVIMRGAERSPSSCISGRSWWGELICERGEGIKSRAKKRVVQ